MAIDVYAVSLQAGPFQNTKEKQHKNQIDEKK